MSDEDLVQSLIFGDDLSLLVECNHTILMNFVLLCLQNMYSAKAQRCPSKYNHFNQVHESSMCLLSGWINRLANMHSKPIAIVRFSMNLYFSHTPLAVWNILSLLQIAMSCTSTMNLYEVAMTILVYQ